MLRRTGESNCFIYYNRLELSTKLVTSYSRKPKPVIISINVAKSTVEKYRVHARKPPSPTWKTFLKNHVQDLVALDFFIVPTVTHKVLFVLLILAHERRRLIHLNITEHPTAEWTAQQMIDAFP